MKCQRGCSHESRPDYCHARLGRKSRRRCCRIDMKLLCLGVMLIFIGILLISCGCK